MAVKVFILFFFNSFLVALPNRCAVLLCPPAGPAVTGLEPVSIFLVGLLVTLQALSGCFLHKAAGLFIYLFLIPGFRRIELRIFSVCELVGETCPGF